ncbi:MAG: gamma-glutamyltransferase, partial [Rhodospirillales bacterium]|nr:gamma-glutamyltransferase [Rhodospirillales bacterium]
LTGFGKGSERNPWRQSRAAGAGFLLFALALGGCATKPDESLHGTAGFIQGFLGGVVADEPRAALAGREILSAGGSAADTAVATYFALSVTLPSMATLGGGGICLAHDPAKDQTQMLDFIAPGPRTAPIQGAGGPGGVGRRNEGPGAEDAAGSLVMAHARPAAIPMNARGFFVLHARYGRLKWAQLPAPAANLARFGVPVSRALARDLAQAGAVIGADAEARRIFGRPDGSGPLREGDRLIQVDLAAMLERVRNQGPGDLHGGEGARQLIQAYRSAGLALDRNDLRESVPVWREPLGVPVEGMGRRSMAYFAVPPAAAGAVAGRIIAQLAERDRYARAGANERAPLFVEAAARALAEGPPLSLAEGSAATAFVAADREGQVVACAVTPHHPFGAGRVAPRTGILAAAVPTVGARGPAALAAMIVNDRIRDGIVFAAAASGGAAAATAMAEVAARTLFEGRLLEDALGQARLHPAGPAGPVYREPRLDDGSARELSVRGTRLAAAPILGVVNALACPGGLRNKPETCSLRADPRALGLAAMAD